MLPNYHYVHTWFCLEKLNRKFSISNQLLRVVTNQARLNVSTYIEQNIFQIVRSCIFMLTITIIIK